MESIIKNIIKGKELTVEDPLADAWSPSEHSLSLLECSPKFPKSFPPKKLSKRLESLERGSQRSLRKKGKKEWNGD